MVASSSSFFASIETIARGNAPVAQWDPPLCGDIDLTICADGQWVMQGRPITRQRLVQLYATVLKREGDEYFLVTPVEKWRITVEDLPFVIVDITPIVRPGMSDVLCCRTNLGERIEVDADHPIGVSQIPGSKAPLIPFVIVRQGLAARFNRASYYVLAELSAMDEDSLFIRSGHYQQMLSLAA